MLKKISEAVWDLLGNEASLFFGKECLTVTMWMMLSLTARACVIVANTKDMLSFGLISHLPFIFTIIQQSNSMNLPTPILTYRLAEIMIGRLSPRKVSAIIPSHFLGCIIGTIVFKAICPVLLFDANGILPPSEIDHNPVHRIVLDSVAVLLFVLLLHVLPQMLVVNHFPRMLIHLAAIPLLLTSLIDKAVLGNTFSPATLYALRFVQFEESFSLAYFLQGGLMIGPILGSLGAGVICAKYFPDDAKQWRSSKKQNK